MAQHNKTFYPYDPLPAQDLNDIIGFMNGIATGVNMEPESIGADTLAQSAKPQFYAGIYSTVAGTGSRQISGFGFKPRLVEATLAQPMGSHDGVTHRNATGVATDDNGTIKQWARYDGGNTSGNAYSGAKQGAFLIAKTGGGGDYIEAAITSFDDDGITINISLMGAAGWTWILKAYA